MKRMMIAVVIMAAFVFVPGSVFASSSHNTTRSNTEGVRYSITQPTTQVGCKKAGGGWIVNAQGKGICNPVESKKNTETGKPAPIRIRLGPMNK